MRRRLRRVRRRFAVLVLGSATLSAAIGAAALLGAVRMDAGTAVAAVLSALALLLYTWRPVARATGVHRAAQVLGLLVAGIGTVVAMRYLAAGRAVEHGAWEAGGDAAVAAAVRISPVAAVLCAGLGIALALVRRQRWRAVAATGAGMVALAGVVFLTAHAWGVSDLVPRSGLPLTAATAAAFLLLGTGTLVASISQAAGAGTRRLLLDPIELKMVGSFAAAVLALFGLGGLAYAAAEDYSLHAQRLVQMHGFREAIGKFSADTGDAVLAQRSHLLTGRAPPGEADWSRQLRQAQALLHRAALSADAEDREGLPPLDAAVAELAAALEAGVRIYREQGAEAARAFVAAGRCTTALAKVRQVLGEMDATELRHLARQEELLALSRRHTLAGAVLTLLTMALVLVGMFLVIRREMISRSAAQRALRRGTSEATAASRFLESVVQNIPHMIFIKEARSLRFVRVNRAGEEIIGLRQADMAGKTDRDFFPPDEADFFIAKDRQVLARGQILDIPHEEIHSATQGVRVLHTKKIPMLDENGRPTHLLGISEDVTEAREREREISSLNARLEARALEVERVNRAKTVFLATMSHEIRTPMNGMLGLLELLSLTPMDDKQRQMLHVVRESGQSLLRIIDDILDFSKIEADRLELHEEPASLGPILHDIRHIHLAAARSKGLDVAVRADPAMAAAVWVDPVRLRQVLNNFVSNAVKFTQHGNVEIRTEVVASDGITQSIRFSVIDSGVGIAPEEQARLFTPFVQVGGAGRLAGGTGLGLVISRRLVELMGGSVELRSELGEGTTVSFTIRLRSAAVDQLPPGLAQRSAELRQQAARIRTAPSAEEATAEGTLVLLVDDHPVNRAVLQQQLRTLGYAAEAVADGHAALAAWESGRFALVVTDCQMPGMDGYELARRIRAREAETGRSRTPIIACTAMAISGEAERCLAAGMDDCVVKPVQLLQLQRKLDEWRPLPVAGTAASPERVEEVIDLPFLRESWAADDAAVEGILASYARSGKEDRAALREAWLRRDLAGVTERAHRMLGASKMVGAHPLAQACTRLNAAARAGDWAAVALAMGMFEAEYARLQAALGAVPGLQGLA